MTQTDTRTVVDGRHDFDFLHGTWSVANRKLRKPLDPSCDEWDAFPATAVTRPVLGGLGNLDEWSSESFPSRPGFEALTLRLFDPGTGLWRIWWASVADPGNLDVPVVGKFEDGHGIFECRDTLGGVDVAVRYEWYDPDPACAEWRQSFSFDDGATWVPNWYMTWRPASRTA